MKYEMNAESEELRARLIGDYENEINFLMGMKLGGVKEVTCSAWSMDENRLDGMMPIDEALTVWTEKLEELRNPANDPNQFNY
jgi:hypothetical protein